MYQTVDQLPPEFLRVPAVRIRDLFPQPALIHLPGQRSQPVFVSILLHGNEDVGLKAVQSVLRRFGDRPLPRALSIFVGNVEAAERNLRTLPGQPDFNRNWPGSELPDCPERRMLAAVVDEMRRRNPFASVDLHNNTGINPLYACICSTENRHLQLASLFSRTVVYFTRPKGVQTMAMQQLCPAITCECGKVGDERGVEQAAELLEACLHAVEIPDHPVPQGDVHLFHTVATVRVPSEVSIAFGEGEADLVFPADLDRWNFVEIGPGAEMAIRAHGTRGRLIVLDDQGRRCEEKYFTQGNSLRLKTCVLPSMLTMDERIIRQDCLCYFMERVPPLPPALG